MAVSITLDFHRCPGVSHPDRRRADRRHREQGRNPAVRCCVDLTAFRGTPVGHGVARSLTQGRPHPCVRRLSLARANVASPLASSRTCPAGYYPDWLSPALVDDQVLDTPGIETTMATFVDGYTLHDSYWIALVTNIWASRVAVRFDEFWSDGRVPHAGSAVAEWPVLIIMMIDLVSTRIQLREAGIGQAISVSVDGSDTHSTTVIRDHQNGSAELVHASKVRIRCSIALAARSTSRWSRRRPGVGASSGGRRQPSAVALMPPPHESFVDRQ